VWLNERTCVFSVDSDDEELRANYWMDVETRALERVSDSLHDFVKMSEQKAAYVKEKNIWTFELTPSGDVPKKWGRPRQEKVSDFKAGDFDSLRWLRYSPENGCFLFCARQKNSAWRYLFRFDPRNKELTQLTHEDTYNGQWVDGGRGFAYVGNTNNSFFLALRCSLPHGRTNIFTRGSVANYVIAETGDRVFATASLGIEPQGIWEYDLRTGDLRTVLPGTTRSNVVCRWVEPQECRTVSFDGLEIPYFMISPVRPMATNGIQVSTTTTIGAKHPIIFYLPPQSYQFQRSFEARSQMMANLGFYFVAVNYRGCDGYGKAYSDLDDPTGAAKDVLAVVDEVCKLRSVDAGNMFLWTSSSGSAAAFELLAVAPERWRGAALISPTSWHDDARFRPKGFPALLFTTGDQDGALPSLQEFKTWAANNGIEAKFVVVRDSGHITFNAAQVASNRKLVARFFIDHIEK
jgi:dipeptidyl aminopeptidase/acylaminoacyl peptidase